MPGVRVYLPGNGDRLKQFLWDTKKPPEKSAWGDHGDREKLREPGRSFSCDTMAPQFPFPPRAEILKHGFPYPWKTTASYLNYFDGSG
jgi:hypothetical protein